MHETSFNKLQSDCTPISDDLLRIFVDRKTEEKAVFNYTDECECGNRR